MSKVIALHHTEVILLRTDQVHFIKNMLRDCVIQTDNKTKCNDAIAILTTISKQLSD
jgi:hypothetical protein